MKQMPFEWAEQTDAVVPSEVALDPETTKILIDLMARTLIAVVRLAEDEADDER